MLFLPAVTSLRHSCDKRTSWMERRSIFSAAPMASYYTGITRRSVEERVSEHEQGIDPGWYTFRRRPVTLVHSEHHERIADAVATERRIKGWSRAKKDAYVR